MRSWVALPWLLLACAAPAPTGGGDAASATGFDVFVLGTAQDGAVPHLGCDKPCCVEARRSGQVRHPVSLGVRCRQTGALLMVEASPAVEAQVALLQQWTRSTGRGRRPVDGLLLTHAHIGHYLGLAHFGREVAGTRGLPVWVSPRFAAFLRGHGPWSQLVELGQIELREFAPDVAFEPLPGLSVTPIPVPHRDEFSDTMVYLLRGPLGAVLFVPDIDRWERVEERFTDLLGDVDVAYVDGSFYDGSELPDRDMREIPHPPIVDTMQRFADRARRAPGAVRFIHFNHSNPVLRDRALQRDLERRGFRMAVRGESVRI